MRAAFNVLSRVGCPLFPFALVLASAAAQADRDRGGPAGEPASRPSHQAATTVPFVLAGDETLARQSGHADSPEGVHGENCYRFLGTIEFLGFRIPLDLQDERPCALVIAGGEFHVVLRQVFCGNCFRVMKVGPRRFTDCCPINELLDDVLACELGGREVTHEFRCWALASAFRAQDPDRAVRLFARFTQEDQRWIYADVWKPYRSTTFTDLLTQQIDRSKRNEFYPDLVRLARHCRAEDDPQVIDFVLLSIWQARPQEAQELFDELDRAIRAGGLQIDSRRTALRTNAARRELFLKSKR